MYLDPLFTVCGTPDNFIPPHETYSIQKFEYIFRFCLDFYFPFFIRARQTHQTGPRDDFIYINLSAFCEYSPLVHSNRDHPILVLIVNLHMWCAQAEVSSFLAIVSEMLDLGVPAPSLVTVARSMEDGYVSFSHVNI